MRSAMSTSPSPSVSRKFGRSGLAARPAGGSPAGFSAAAGDPPRRPSRSDCCGPESFTHGTAEQRRRWFLKGLRSGDLSQGNAFEVPYDQL